MLKNIDEEVLKKACSLWEINKNTLTFLGGMENSVYSFNQNKTDYILRIGNANHMSYKLVQSELDWVQFLSKY